MGVIETIALIVFAFIFGFFWGFGAGGERMAKMMENRNDRKVTQK